MCVCASFEVGTRTNTSVAINFVKSAKYSTSDSTKTIPSQLPHLIESSHCSRKSHINISRITIGTKVTWSKSVDVAKVLACDFDTLRERLFTFTDPDTRVIELLVRLVGAFWVANLGKEVILLLEDEVPNTSKICELGVSVYVHLDNTMVNGSLDFLLGRARATMEDEEKWLLILSADLALGIRLVFGKKFGVQLYVTRFVNTVHVSKRSRYAKVGADCRECGVYVVHFLRLGVQAAVLDTGVINAIFFTARDTNFLEPDTQRRHAFEIFDASCDVLILRLLGEVKHVGRE